MIIVYSITVVWVPVLQLVISDNNVELAWFLFVHTHRVKHRTLEGVWTIFYKSESNEVRMKLVFRMTLTCKHSVHSKNTNAKRQTNVISSQPMYSTYHVLENSELEKSMYVRITCCETNTHYMLVINSSHALHAFSTVMKILMICTVKPFREGPNLILVELVARLHFMKYEIKYV